ncbi:lasso peptide biosynthesis PqqD family chaperone [Paenibacillus spiritus]|uniref:Lasso peptide biosynthesis PqqD family chaperone n=1 Tax=Paenibacillus spiritus TaxID=2496557 RepID=A0A5J5FVA1_9BACL|nr:MULTISPECIES: lasso peptide biosynthesis PqqD family chaperone [Paenibacillus]KAA8997547.1 lasso peptide biosynthesis PqqD family chaperone [Paenibacillus spiritus]
MSKNTALSPETVVVQCEGNVVSDMDGEKVMFNLEQGKYYNLGQVGGDIWSLIESPRTVQALIVSLQEIYEIDAEICEQDVMPFLQHLLSEGLIRIDGPQ